MAKRGINEESSNVSPAEIQKYLAGIDYPATKDELIDTAEENGATDDVIDIIKELPDEEYGGPQDVMKAYGDVK